MFIIYTYSSLQNQVYDKAKEGIVILCPLTLCFSKKNVKIKCILSFYIPWVQNNDSFVFALLFGLWFFIAFCFFQRFLIVFFFPHSICCYPVIKSLHFLIYYSVAYFYLWIYPPQSTLILSRDRLLSRPTTQLLLCALFLWHSSDSYWFLNSFLVLVDYILKVVFN